MIIVDTSIWVVHLRKGHSHLEELLLEAEVACHPFIIGELACGNIRNRKKLLALLQTLPMAQTATSNELLHCIERNRVINIGIGFVDVHLLAAARLSGMPLWSLDKKLSMTAKKLDVAYN